MHFYNINQCLLMYRIIGVYPEKSGSKIQSAIFLWTFTALLSVYYLNILFFIYNYESLTLEEAISALESNGIMFHGMFKLTVLFLRKSQVCDLLERMEHLFWKIEDIENLDRRRPHLKYLENLKNVCRVFTSICATTTLAFILRPIFLHGSYLTFDTYNPEWIPYYALWLFESMVFVTGIWFPVSGLDIIMLSILMLTKLQFRLLNEELTELFDSEADMKNVDQRIGKCVRHHAFLIDYVKRINKTFSEAMLFYVGVITISMCVEMYLISTRDSLKASFKSMSYIFNGLVQYSVCYCVPAQAISDEAYATAYSIYSSKWYEHPTHSVKIAVLMIMAKAQHTLPIVAGGFLIVNLDTCFKTIKTMVSYCMFLRTMTVQPE
nr:odorant receptor [Semanotus bifasciatus]